MSDATRTGLIWDLPTRLFHWLLALCFCGSWITAEAGIEWTETHFLLGYSTLALVMFRVAWGFFGPRYARFSNFLRGPAACLAQARQLFSRSASASVGHNPLGGLMIVLMLLSLGVQAGTGLFISDDIFYAGPWNGAVSGDVADTLRLVHHTNFQILQGAIALHLLAALFYWVYKKQNLVGPMVTGRKQIESSTEEVSHSRIGVALLVAVIAGTVVALVVIFAPPPAPLDYY